MTLHEHTITAGRSRFGPAISFFASQRDAQAVPFSFATPSRPAASAIERYEVKSF